MKCINCGTNEAVEHGLCSACITSSIKINTPGVYEITVCPKCESVQVGKRWMERDGHALFEKKLLNSISSNDETAKIHIEDSSIRINAYKGTATLFISVERPNIPDIHREIEIPYKVRKVSCPSCNKATGSYYEAKVQIRGFKDVDSKILENVTNYILNRMETLSKKSGDSFVSSVERLTEGYDIYLGKKNDSDKVCREISRDYFSSLNVSKTLAGMKEGHEIYRYTYSMRILDLLPGDILDVNGVEFMVKKVSPQVLYLIDLERKRDLQMRQSEFFSSRFSIRGITGERRKLIRISGDEKETVFMDARDFRQIILEEKISDEEIDIFLYREDYYRV